MVKSSCRFSINDIQYQNAKADFQKYINAQKNK